MGQIIIDVPSRTKRRYKLSSKKQAEEIVSELEKSAVRIRTTKSSQADLEFAVDVRDVGTAVAEVQRTGKTHSWNDVKSELGL